MKTTRHTAPVIVAMAIIGALLGVGLRVYAPLEGLMLTLKAGGLAATVGMAFFWQLVRELKEVRAADHLDPMRTRMLRDRTDSTRRRSWAKLWLIAVGSVVTTTSGFSEGIIKPGVAIPLGFSALAVTLWCALSLVVTYRFLSARVERLAQEKSDRKRRAGSIGFHDHGG